MEQLEKTLEEVSKYSNEKIKYYDSFKKKGIKRKQDKIDFYNSIKGTQPLNYDLLVNNTNKIIERFTKVPLEKLNSWGNDDYELHIYDKNKIFKGGKNKPVENIKQFFDISIMPIIDQNENYDLIVSELEPKFMVACDYLRMLHKLRTLEIEILSLEDDLSQYKCRGVSGCGGGTDVFGLVCKKGNYIFSAKFEDDCDCKGGILFANEVYNTQTQFFSHIRTDLYSQAGGEKSEVFIDLITFGPDYVIGKYYAPYLALKDNIQKRFPDSQVTEITPFLTDHVVPKTGFCIKIQCQNKTLFLKKAYDHSVDDEFIISKYQTFYYMSENKKNKLDLVDLSIYKKKGSYNSKKKTGYKIIYQTGDDMIYIEKAIQSLINDYGYCEDGIYYNDSHLMKLFRQFLNGKLCYLMTCNNDPKIMDGKIIDFMILIKLDKIKDEPYIKYQIHFTYDIKNDPQNCHLLIDFKGYSDQTINFQGKFTELYDIIKKLLEKIGDNLKSEN
jgi:hypothetical protein